MKLPKWDIYSHNYIENSYWIELKSAIKRERAIIEKLRFIKMNLSAYIDGSHSNGEMIAEIKLNKLIAELEEQ